MIKHLILLALMTSPALLFAQDKQKTLLQDTLNNAEPLTDEQFKKILNQQFTNIITGRTQSSVGNYAAIDLKESEVAFAGTIPVKLGHLFTVKAGGGITDGFFAIFDNSKLNTSTSLDLQYNIWHRTDRDILGYWDDSKTRHRNAEASVNFQHDLRVLEINHHYDRLKLKEKQAKLITEIDSLKKSLTAVTSDKRPMIEYQISKKNFLKDSVDMALDVHPSSASLLQEAGMERAAKLKKLDTLLEVASFKVGWWSFGLKVKNNEFFTFNPALALDQQVKETRFVTKELRLQWSKYRWTRVRNNSYYWSAGVAVSHTDNFANLTKLELSETTNYDPTPGKRASTNKYNAYSGEYEDKILNWRLYGEAYYFLFKNNIAALHIYPELNLNKDSKPISNLGLGFLLSFKDEKSSVVNAELYYNLLDVFDTTNSDYSSLNRNSIGLRFAFPITFKN